MIITESAPKKTPIKFKNKNIVVISYKSDQYLNGESIRNYLNNNRLLEQISQGGTINGENIEFMTTVGYDRGFLSSSFNSFGNITTPSTELDYVEDGHELSKNFKVYIRIK